MLTRRDYLLMVGEFVLCLLLPIGAFTGAMVYLMKASLDALL